MSKPTMTPAELFQTGLRIINHAPATATVPGQAELLVHVAPDGVVTAFNGHVDLGTGIRTALSQIVAEELDVPIGHVRMVLGDTSAGPDQGATLASTTIQVTAIPLRKAAAQARQWLIGEAATFLQCSPDMLRTEDGRLHLDDGSGRSFAYGEIIGDRSIDLPFDDAVTVKSPDQYRLVGRSTPRVDIPDKVTGAFTYVHDVRVPGMVHGRVIRPPYAGIDNGPFVGTSLLEVDESSVRDIPTLIAVVTIGDFVGVVAEREEDAILAASRLVTTWKDIPDLPDMTDLEQALRNNVTRPRQLIDKGNVEQALKDGPARTGRTYVWPYQMHGSIGPSCAVAHVTEEGATIWSGTQNPHWLQADIATLLDIPYERVTMIRHEASGCYGRNCADDVAADAALLSRAVGRPVRVQLSREQEHAWEPKGPACLISIDGNLDAQGNIGAYDFENWWPGNRAPTLALLLTGAIPPTFEFGESGDRTAIPPYDYENLRVKVNDSRPIVRASWFRGVASLPNSFAHESFIDEMAYKAGVDPVEYRLRHLKDPRGRALIEAVAKRANWQPRTKPRLEGDGDIMRGQGFAYALYVHSKFPGFGAAWSAWVAEVEVRRSTGEVRVTNVIAGQDTGLMINPAGVRHQLHGNVVQATSRVLKEEVRFEKNQVASKEWGAYPIISFVEVPNVDALLLKRDEEPPVGAGESATVPSAAAIANAIYDATGVRFREVPFTPERVKAGLEAAAALDKVKTQKKKGWFYGLLGSGAAAIAGFTAALAWHGPLAPISRPDPSSFPAELVERGRELAAAGACAVCHTSENGAPYAGGHRLETPFGAIYTTNITPDVETGIGSWSYAAFERAMRHGIHRDGQRLYPAFPYTSYAKMTDGDMQALYAYMMSLEPVKATRPQNELSFPFNQRVLLAGWNALFHNPAQFEPDPQQSALWNRGAYLVEGPGHCSACHSPRNLLGAERKGASHLAGAMIDGWEAPALTALSKSPVPWTEDALYAYLRHGYSSQHGVAAGPMAPVVSELAALPDADIRAMAHYLASLNGNPTEEQATAALRQAEHTASLNIAAGQTVGARIFEGACAVCHTQPGSANQMFGIKPQLALNTNIHSDRPDNLVRVILEGITDPAYADHGAMPGFRTALNDQQLEALVAYLRKAFAPDKPAWVNLPDTIARLRAAAH
jgi:nicotinate dehydrogenase subunit B